MDIQQIKQDFPLLQKKVNAKTLTYLDNAATTQKPQQVIDAITTYYENDNANVHRSVHTLASRASIAYEDARKTVAKFIGAQDQEIIFTRGTTDGFNKITRSLSRSSNLFSNQSEESFFQDGDEILLSEMEHHANIIPWQEIVKDLQKQNINVTIKWIPLTNDYQLDLDVFKNLISSKTKVLSLTHISNVLGTINPIKHIIQTAKKINSQIITIVDAAQSVPHMPVDVKDLACDMLLFSSHKLLGPTGIGVLYGRKELLERIEPFNFGGDMIKTVSKTKSTYNDLPYKFEAGTPSIAQAVGLNAAINYLQTTVGGMQVVKDHANELTHYMLEKLMAIPSLTVIGSTNSDNRTSVVSFIIKGIHNHDINEVLNQEGIAIRVGQHCAMPLMQTMDIEHGTLRASAYLYNSKEDIDTLVLAINKAINIFQ